MKIERSKNDFKSENTCKYVQFFQYAHTDREKTQISGMNCENAERVNMKC